MLLLSLTALIRLCNIIIPINPKPRQNKTKEGLVFIRNIITISPYITLSIPITHSFSSTPRKTDFLFEPGNLLVSLFTHLTNFETHFMLARNNTPIAIQIPANYYVRRLIKFEYKESYIVNIFKDPIFLELTVKGPLLSTQTKVPIIYSPIAILPLLVPAAALDGLETVYRSRATIYGNTKTVNVIS